MTQTIIAQVFAPTLSSMLRILLLYVALCSTHATFGYLNSGKSDSLDLNRRKHLLTELARLITDHASFNGITMRWNYEARVDTLKGLRLYVAEQITLLGDKAEPDWYYIDFNRPVQPGDIKVVMYRKGNFSWEASKRVNHSVRSGKGKNMSIMFFTDNHKRTVDYNTLYEQLLLIMQQLTGLPPE